MLSVIRFSSKFNSYEYISHLFCGVTFINYLFTQWVIEVSRMCGIKPHQGMMNLGGGEFDFFASINIFERAHQHGNNVLNVYAEKKNFSNFQSGRWKEPVVYSESEDYPFYQREGTYRGLAIRWPQFAHRIGRSHNQRLLSFQHDVFCPSILEAWDPKLTLDQQKLLAFVHRILKSSYTGSWDAFISMHHSGL